MSLLPRKELRVVLCPDKVVAVAWTIWLRRRVISQVVLPALPSNASDWRPAMEMLAQWLTDNELSKAEATILLSNCFVRFAMMPFSDGVSDRAERLTVAGWLFESIYGETAKQWKPVLDDEEYGEPCLVAAMDSALWDALNQMNSSGHLKMISMQPYAASVVNSFNKQIQSDNCLLAVIEYGQAVLIDIKDKKIVGVRKANLNLNSDEQEISSLLQREALISGLHDGGAKIYLHIADNPNLKTPTVAGIDLIVLRNDKGNSSALVNEDSRYEMIYAEDME